MTQSTIDFLLNNNITIIQIVFGIIFVLVVFVILKSFKEEKIESAQSSKKSSKAKHSDPDDDLMEGMSIDEDASPSAAAAASTTSESNPLDDLDNLDELMAMDQMGEVQSAAPAVPDAELTQALSEKEKVISDLKAEIANLQEKTKSKGNSSELETKVKELSEKLSEYEIIEDDIANLSFYKNENTKLKNELEKLKGISNGDSEVAQASAPIPQPPEPKDNSALDEFEEAVRQKETLEKNQTVVANSTPPSKGESDLLKEFESVVDKELAAPETKSASPTPPQQDINSDKLVEEMETLAGTTPTISEEESEKANNQKLIEEFENFVNKG